MTVSILSMLLFVLSSGSAEEVVEVHEWGVVQADEVTPSAVGARRGYLDDHGIIQPPEAMAVDAPVVWFHGPAFTGSFQVEVTDGYFTTLIPEPECSDILDETQIQPRVSSVVWDHLECFPAEEMPHDRRATPGFYVSEGYEWAMDFWRRVPSLTVSYSDADYLDRFIYYECSASGIFQNDDPFGDYSGEWLLFSEDDRELSASLCSGLPSDPFVEEVDLNTEKIMEILAEWGENQFMDEEISALWMTWEPAFRTQCLVYGQEVFFLPLSHEQTEDISTLQLETDQGYRVSYSRLFLATGSI